MTPLPPDFRWAIRWTAQAPRLATLRGELLVGGRSSFWSARATTAAMAMSLPGGCATAGKRCRSSLALRRASTLRERLRLPGADLSDNSTRRPQPKLLSSIACSARG